MNTSTQVAARFEKAVNGGAVRRATKAGELPGRAGTVMPTERMLRNIADGVAKASPFNEWAIDWRLSYGVGGDVQILVIGVSKLPPEGVEAAQNLPTDVQARDFE